MGRMDCTEPQCLYRASACTVPRCLYRVSVPVQSLSACTEPLCLYRASVPLQSLGVFTEPQCLYRTSVPVEVCTLLFTFLYSILRCNTFCFRSTYWLCHLYTVQRMSANEDMKLIPFNFLYLPENGWKKPFLIPSW